MSFIEVRIPLEVFPEYDIDKDIIDAVAYNHYRCTHIPFMVNRWLKEFVIKELTLQKGEYMPYSVERTIGFEVEVFTRMQGDKEVAYKAECHTVCPSFVAAWIENEAMKQYNKENQICISSPSPSIPL